MIPLVDCHCHLLAGLDDGPRTPDDAMEMCRMSYEDGTRLSVALAHQGEDWPAVTPEAIRAAASRLTEQLRDANLPLAVFPTAEIMARPDLDLAWQRGELMSIADRGTWLLVEMPHGLFVDLRPVIRRLREQGVRIVLAHPERHPELLHEPGAIEGLIGEGCLVQVGATSVTEPRSSSDRKALKRWFRDGCVHLMGSDGHSPRRRRPLLGDAYRQVRSWVGDKVADRVFATHGTAILCGLGLHIPPLPPRSWWRRWFG